MIEYIVPRSPTHHVFFEDFLHWYKSTYNAVYTGNSQYRYIGTTNSHRWVMAVIRLDTEEDLVAFKLRFGV